MNIGFLSFFPYRPHVKNIVFLEEALSKEGHNTFYLSCRASVPLCYYHAYQGKKKNLMQCMACQLGGIQTFKKKGITYINSDVKSHISTEKKIDWTEASISSIYRAETKDDIKHIDIDEVQDNLGKSVEIVFENTKNWIILNNINAVICFNGRMDLPRAAIEACITLDIPYISVEFSWFGFGISMLPNENCLGLKTWKAISLKFKDKPLIKEQALAAAAVIAKRIVKLKTSEWRQYHIDSKNHKWETRKNNSRKILVLPSSKYEFKGHKDWETDLPDDFFELFNEFIIRTKIDRDGIILRGHPVWSQKISGLDGSHIEKKYISWSLKNSITYIKSNEKIDTFNLIEQADIIVVNGGSAALEAGILGKHIICLGQSRYSCAGFVKHVNVLSELTPDLVNNKLEELDIKKRALRFIYCALNRIPQFTKNIQPSNDITTFLYYNIDNINGIIKAINKNSIEASDTTYCKIGNGERDIINLIDKREWDKIIVSDDKSNIFKPTSPSVNIKRRFPYSLLERLRYCFRRGDL